MEVPVSDAKAQLTDLVRRAEAGEEIVLTRHGHAIVRLAPVARKPTPEEKRLLMEEVQRQARASGPVWPAVTSNHDFLYDEFGLPK